MSKDMLLSAVSEVPSPRKLALLKREDRARKAIARIVNAISHALSDNAEDGSTEAKVEVDITEMHPVYITGVVDAVIAVFEHAGYKIRYVISPEGPQSTVGGKFVVTYSLSLSNRL